MPPPVVDEATRPAATIEITTRSDAERRQRRRPRWVIDPGNTPLGRPEVYTLITLAVVLLVAAFAAFRLLWPESTGGVRTFD